MELFGRKYSLQIDELLIEDLTIDFDVKTSMKREPNTAKIRVMNLNESHRDQIDSLARIGSVQLKAGHQTTGIGTIFIGDISKAGSELEAGTWVTTIEAGDGRRRVRTGRVSASHAPGSPVSGIMDQVARAVGVGLGNLTQTLNGITRSTSATETVHGNAADSLDRLAASEGLEWSIQRGNFQFVPRGQALAGEAIVLRPGTGLIGSPSRDKDGTVSASANLMPDLFPGRRVRLESRKIVGNFRCERAQYQGNSARGEWKIALKLKTVD